jgi:hypothetical protein
MRIKLRTSEDEEGALIAQNNAQYAISGLEKHDASVESGTSITVLM